MSIEKIDALLKKLTEVDPGMLGGHALKSSLSDIVKYAELALAASEKGSMDAVFGNVEAALDAVAKVYKNVDRESYAAIQKAQHVLYTKTMKRREQEKASGSSTALGSVT